MKTSANKINQILLTFAVLASILYFIFKQAIIGNYWYVVILIIIILFVLFLRFRYRNQHKKLFQEPSPEKMVEHNKKVTNKGILNYEAILAFNTALPYCLWGDFDNAKAIINKVDWDQLPEIFQAMKLTINSLERYFTGGNYQEGLDFSVQARDLATIDSYMPGAKRSNQFYEILVYIGEVLTGDFNSELEEKLLRISKSDADLMGKLLVSWALANGYKGLGQEEKAQQMINFCKTTAPYCKPLVKFAVK